MQGLTLGAEILPVLFKQMALISSCWILEGAVDDSDTSPVLSASQDFTAVICNVEYNQNCQEHLKPKTQVPEM